MHPGPTILEYYSATEAMGVTFCDSAEWLAHLGTVGRTVAGESIGGQVVDLEAQALERDEVGEHRLIKRLRKAAGEILPRRSFGAQVGGQP